MNEKWYITVFLLMLLQVLHKSYSLPTQLIMPDAVWTIEVPYGKNVVLQCHSNDADHNFDFWVVENQQVVIGPSNGNYDIRKFKYEILSGNLTIRAISKTEEGVYSCYSRGVRKDNVKMNKINLLVEKQYEEIYEHDHNINVIRILIVLIAFVLLAAGGYIVYRIWQDRFRYPNYLEQGDDDDEDSAEEIFSAPSTSRPKSPMPIVIEKNKTDNDTFETISTDFTSILDANR